MGIGELRERITFSKRNLQADDGYGNVESEFEDQFTVYGQVSPIKGRITTFLGEESNIAQKLTPVQPVKLRVRYSRESKLIQPDWRAKVVSTGEFYNILSIANPDEKHGYFEMLAQSGVPI